jgi:hypothetical protein
LFCLHFKNGILSYVTNLEALSTQNRGAINTKALNERLSYVLMYVIVRSMCCN